MAAPDFVFFFFTAASFTYLLRVYGTFVFLAASRPKITFRVLYRRRRQRIVKSNYV